MKRILYIIIGIVVLASCEDVIDVELNDQDQDIYFVEAQITTIDEPWVRIMKTLPVTSDEDYNGTSNAVVIISDDAVPANEVVLVEDAEEKGLYVVPENIDYYGVVGRTYTITIETPENTTITSTEEIFPVEPIDSIEIHPSLRGDSIFLAIFTYGLETPGYGNYYKWDIYINDTLLNGAEYLAFASDELVDGNYISRFEIFTDFHDPDEESERLLNLNDVIYVKQNSISRFAYDFYFQMINQASTGFLFSVPPANLPTNFISSDGKTVAGIFTAHDVSVSNSVLIDASIDGELKEP